MLNVDKKIGSCPFIHWLVARFAAVRSSLSGQMKSQQFELPLMDEPSAKFVIILAIGVIVYGGLLSLGEFRQMLESIRSYRLGQIYLGIVRLLLELNIAVFLWRVLLVVRYRPFAGCADKKLPRCTVIVPAYNEGKGVLTTLKSVLQSDYPAEKLQIIAVDDGSVDDTFEWIKEACRSAPGRVQVVHYKKNRGKRHAIFEGIIRSSGQIIVTIDSDSVIEPQTLRRLVTPFVKNKMVGAVAGNVRVLNRDEGLIPKMLDVIFAYSFDFLRASQSMVNTVFCTPGALSAYRKEAVMKNLNAWLHQTFMGTNANIGEDRALTNMILKDGWSVVFQSNAVVYTIVPTNYVKLCKMFLRWARSNVRETLAMATFIFRRFRNAPVSGARINFIMSCINLVFPHVIASLILGFVFIRPEVYFAQLMLGVVIGSTAPAVFYALRQRSSDSLWAYAYGLFWFVALWWITPWAIVTCRNGNWLTRQLPAARRVASSVATPHTGILQTNLGTAA